MNVLLSSSNGELACIYPGTAEVTAQPVCSVQRRYLLITGALFSVAVYLNRWHPVQYLWLSSDSVNLQTFANCAETSGEAVFHTGHCLWPHSPWYLIIKIRSFSPVLENLWCESKRCQTEELVLGKMFSSTVDMLLTWPHSFLIFIPPSLASESKTNKCCLNKCINWKLVSDVCLKWKLIGFQDNESTKLVLYVGIQPFSYKYFSD